MLASIHSNNDSISDSSNDSEVSTFTKKRGNFSLSSNNITQIRKSFLSSTHPVKHRPTFNFNSKSNLESNNSIDNKNKFMPVVAIQEEIEDFPAKNHHKTNVQLLRLPKVNLDMNDLNIS
jgi:hypothetical protein